MSDTCDNCRGSVVKASGPTVVEDAPDIEDWSSGELPGIDAPRNDAELEQQVRIAELEADNAKLQGELERSKRHQATQLALLRRRRAQVRGLEANRTSIWNIPTYKANLERLEQQVRELQRLNHRGLCGCEESAGVLGCAIGCACRCHALESQCAAMREALKMAAPHHQGGHSKVGRAIEAALSSTAGTGEDLVTPLLSRATLEQWKAPSEREAHIRADERERCAQHLESLGGDFFTCAPAIRALK